MEELASLSVGALEFLMVTFAFFRLVVCVYVLLGLKLILAVCKRAGAHELTLARHHKILAHFCLELLLEALHVLAHFSFILKVLFVSGQSLFLNRRSLGKREKVLRVLQLRLVSLEF